MAPPEEAPSPAPSGSATGRLRAALPPLLFLGVFVLLATILIRSMGAAVRDPDSDDGYYLVYMQRVSEAGLSAFPRLFEVWNSTEGAWIYPPPSRVGFVVVSALCAKVFGASYETLQGLSLASHLLLVVVCYLFARRHLGEPRALFVGALIGFSPLLMGISRLALTDSFNALCMTTTVWLFFELVSRPEKLAVRIGFMAALAFMVLVKELSVLLVVPFSAFLLYERFVREVPHRLGRFALWFVISGLVAAPLFVLAAGGLDPLLVTTRIVLTSPATNAYAIQYGSGPWFRTIVDFLLLSPWPTLLAIGWFFVTAVQLRDGRYERLSVFLGFVVGFQLLLFSFFTKNIRYNVVLELPIRLFAVLLVWETFSRLRPARRVATTAAVVGILCALDWWTFQGLWVEGHGYDPVTYLLALFRHVVPPPMR